MSTGKKQKTRSTVKGLQLPPGKAERLWECLRRGDVWLRIGMAFAAAIAMWAVTFAWAPRFPYRSGTTPLRDIVAHSVFQIPDEAETEKQRALAQRQALAVYRHDRRSLVELRQGLKDAVIQLLSAESFESFAPEVQKGWQAFLVEAEPSAENNEEQLFNDFREALSDEEAIGRFEVAVERAFSTHERDGLLIALDHELDEGSQSAILVHDVGQEDFTHRVEVRDVHIAEATATLRQRLYSELEAAGLPAKHLGTVSQLTFNWITNQKLPSTLTLNSPATLIQREKAAAQVKPEMREYHPGEKLVTGRQPLSQEDINLLLEEHRSWVAGMPWGPRLRHSLADIGMYVAMYVLCGTYLFFHHPIVLQDLKRLASLLGLVVATVTLCMIASNDQWYGETIPLTMFGLTIAIAYERELALLLSASVALVVAMSIGLSLAEFVIIVSSVAASILLLDRIRSRTKLIYVGMGAAVVAAATAIGVGTLTGQAYGWSGEMNTPFGDFDELIQETFLLRLLSGALWLGICAILSGLLMTGLLPFIEKGFDVQTDISLLELGDAAHPLLQELVRRAPGTYNHSITVASLSEAAAESIGANGLLVRVGAYFHDIGKMLKPGYFVENQGEGGNRHDSLVPAMSTLVIIAHVKDGADLARQHHLPRSIIDFIEQHHGTTLVEYFYREATKQSEENPDCSDVDETTFRYPGPKPQTKESGILMLADAAESTCRTLVDPAPSRIEHVVHELTMKRLLDGQFDECGLTLKEIHTVQESLVKSLAAVYHGRVKYPDTQPA